MDHIQHLLDNPVNHFFAGVLLLYALCAVRVVGDFVCAEVESNYGW